jgi:hypothetical protein
LIKTRTKQKAFQTISDLKNKKKYYDKENYNKNWSRHETQLSNTVSQRKKKKIMKNFYGLSGVAKVFEIW